MGDAAGIGPEVIIKTLSQIKHRPDISIIVVGELWAMEQAAKSLKSSLCFASEENAREGAISVRSLGVLNPGDFKIGTLSAECGHGAFAYFDHAVDCCQSGEAAAIVTAPINKEAINLAGHKYMGHTHILEKRVNVPVVMCLVHPKVFVSHVTDHMPLRQALGAITPERIREVVHLTYSALKKTRTPNPRIALAGINPHAGENGLLGSEELDILIPTIKKMAEEGLNIQGPFPADTIFLSALQGRLDGIIAMYHDQGFGPMKTIDFAHGVNCTLGLPFARTSPDHGTAFEIAGKGVADPTSMIEAWKLAVSLSCGTDI